MNVGECDCTQKSWKRQQWKQRRPQQQQDAPDSRQRGWNTLDGHMSQSSHSRLMVLRFTKKLHCMMFA